MAPHGYIPFLQDYLTKLKHKPNVLEVGIDRGVTLIPLVIALASAHDSYLYMGVDVNVQESVKLITHYLGPAISQNTFLMQDNSLNILPKMASANMKFDLVILDGDHNYHTVSQELTHLNDIVSPTGIVLIDDYDGKWSERDMWYAERPGYEQNDKVTKPVKVDNDKQGVKPAVDEWLSLNQTWMKTKPIKEGEPVLLSRQPIGL